MIKSNNDESFKVIHKQLPNYNLSIPFNPDKKSKTQPIQLFTKQIINLFQSYIKSKSQKYFLFWMLQYFSSTSNDSNKNNKVFQNFIGNWKHHSVKNKQVQLFLYFLDNSYGTQKVISQFLRLRKQIIKYSSIKSLSKITLDYQNILYVFNKLYSDRIKVDLCRQLKIFYQKIRTPFKCDTKLQAPVLCCFVIQNFVEQQIQQQQSQHLPHFCLDVQSRLISIDSQSQSSIRQFIISESTISNAQQQNTFLLDSIVQAKHTDSATLSIGSSLNNINQQSSLQAYSHRRQRFSLIYQQQLFQSQMRQNYLLHSSKLIFSIKQQTQMSQDSDDRLEDIPNHRYY